MKTSCKTLMKINEDGSKVFKDKSKFETLEDAISVCKKLNSKGERISKVVSYKCSVCHKYHIGRNGKKLKQKYKTKLLKNSRVNFKIIGKINLDKIK